MDPGNSAPFAIGMLGLLLGMRHATDPDHVIAVTAILTRERRFGTAARIGVVWGLGHTLTVLAVGTAIIVFKLAIPVRLGLAMEFAVALVLILLGLNAFGAMLHQVSALLFTRRRALAEGPIIRSHVHLGGPSHRLSQGHWHLGDFSRGTVGGASRPQSDHEHALPCAVSQSGTPRPLLRSFGVGLVHGLAGSAAIALVVLSAIPNPLWATLYLVIFCTGTIIGMALITTAIGAPMIAAERRVSSLHQRLVVGSGLLSFAFGLFLAYRIGVVDRLFGVVPIWVPH